MSLFSAGLAVAVSVLCSMLYKPTTILTVWLDSCYKKDLELEVENVKITKPQKLCEKILTKRGESGRILKLSRDRVLQKKRKVKDRKGSGARGSDLRQNLRAVKKDFEKNSKNF